MGFEQNRAAASHHIRRRSWKPQRTDLAVFALLAGGFYLSILVVAVFWWRFRTLRRAEHAKIVPESLVAEPLMQLAESAGPSAFSVSRFPLTPSTPAIRNAPLEQNFLMQLRAIYKLVLEWRRQENDWAEDDRRIVEDENDPWLNGADEFVLLIGPLYALGHQSRRKGWY
jgi:hypothetical protein